MKNAALVVALLRLLINSASTTPVMTKVYNATKKMRERIVTTLAVLTFVLGWALPGHGSVIELTSRPTTNDMIFWSQFGSTSGSLPATDNFTSTHGISGSVNLNGLSGFLGIQCCIIVNNNLVGNFSGGFAPGDFVLSTYLGPMTINFDTPVRAVGAQIQDGTIGDHFTAEVLAFDHALFLGAFTENGFSGDLGDNSNIFLGVRSDSADITSVVYLTFTADPFRLQSVNINQMSIDAPAATPIPAVLPLFATEARLPNSTLCLPWSALQKPTTRESLKN